MAVEVHPMEEEVVLVDLSMVHQLVFLIYLIQLQLEVEEVLL